MSTEKLQANLGDTGSKVSLASESLTRPLAQSGGESNILYHPPTALDQEQLKRGFEDRPNVVESNLGGSFNGAQGVGNTATLGESLRAPSVNDRLEQRASQDTVGAEFGESGNLKKATTLEGREMDQFGHPKELQAETQKDTAFVKDYGSGLSQKEIDGSGLVGNTNPNNSAFPTSRISGQGWENILHNKPV